MKIWHVGAASSPEKVCGVNNTVWLVAREQARLGHQVALLVDKAPDKGALALAAETGLELIHTPASRWRYEPEVLEPLLRSAPPQLVHMHSVFVPKQAFLAKNLVRKGIPYAITPHAMAPEILRRGRLKKTVYSWLLEKPRFMAASAITVVTPKEAETVRAFVPGYQGIVRWVPNPINIDKLEGPSWCGDVGAKRLVYLGRFDVLHKGIDILVEMGRSLPDIEFHLYGTEDDRTKEWLERLKRNLPKNVHFHTPVFGVEKNQVLADATLYIQMSRWEVFGVSIAEAMYLGVPCALADTLNFAEIFQERDLGLVLPSNPKEAAIRLKEVFSEPHRLQEWSARGRAFAQEEFQPPAVASSYLKVYQEAIGV